MDPEADATGYYRMADDRTNHLISDPLTAERDRLTNRPKDSSQMGRTQDDMRNRKPRSNDGKITNNVPGNSPKPFDLTDNDTRLLTRRPVASDSGTFPDMDYNGLVTSPVDLNNWDWLRLDALGPAWELALRDVPVNRREALNLLIIMKKKLLRAANELTFYKERVTLLQEQLIYQKKNEEKFIRLRAAYKAQNEELERLKEKVGKVPGLERTVQQQEELISRLEGFLERQRIRQTNNTLNNRANLTDPMTSSFLDIPPSSPSPMPIPSDTAAATALRNLSDENESLRQTVTELNRTVRNLAQQQQDDHLRLKQQEKKYREDLEALREHQNRLSQQQAIRNRQIEQVQEQDNQRKEKMDLYRMLAAADERVKRLEEELELRDSRPNAGPLPGPSVFYRKQDGYKEQPWKYPGQDKLPSRLPPVPGGSRDRLNRGRRNPHEYPTTHASDSGLTGRPSQPESFRVRRGSSVGDEDWFGDTGFEDF
ncbi:Normocyte binding protein 2a [Fasciola gigantica]|uniref:Normocyte binding protein 2a n=1 Tax=Fasciola gigantica TaxID=46835 RepID=A0A504Z215_FASGI|nr:Normocyte binding protein 2a [Fasciola gigantica]